MIINYLELNVDASNPSGIANAMFRFWKFQLEEATTRYQADFGRVQGAAFANKEALEEWKRSDDLGFGVPVPYSQKDIDQLKRNLEQSQKEWQEAKAMYDYFVKYIFDNLRHEK